MSCVLFQDTDVGRAVPNADYARSAILEFTIFWACKATELRMSPSCSCKICNPTFAFFLAGRRRSTRLFCFLAGAPRSSFAPSLSMPLTGMPTSLHPAGTRRTKNRWGQVGLAGPVVHAGAPFHGPTGPRDRRPLGRQGRDLGVPRGAPGSGSPAVGPARASIFGRRHRGSGLACGQDHEEKEGVS